MIGIADMIPQCVQPFFWDVDLGAFQPAEHPAYTIARILELGDDAAVIWLRQIFSEEEIKAIIRSDRRLSRRSAHFWALVYRISTEEVAALH